MFVCFFEKKIELRVVYFKIFNKMFFKKYFLMGVELSKLSDESTNSIQKAY